MLVLFLIQVMSIYQVMLSLPTRVKFPSPVPLEPETEYAIVLLAPTTNLYEAWIAQMGERTVNTQSLPDAEAVVVTRPICWW